MEQRVNVDNHEWVLNGDGLYEVTSDYIIENTRTWMDNPEYSGYVFICKVIGEELHPWLLLTDDSMLGAYINFMNNNTDMDIRAYVVSNINLPTIGVLCV